VVAHVSAHAPPADEYRATFFADKAMIHQRAQGIDSVLEIAVSPEDDVEVRRLSLTNRSPHLREIEFTSYVEWCWLPRRRSRPPGVRQAVSRD
jgi:cellobiose phosphorylase